MSSTPLNGPAASLKRQSSRDPRRDPLAGVLSLGPRIPVAVMVAAAVLAVSVHAGAAVGAVQAAVLHAFSAWARDVHGAVSAHLAQTYDVDFIKPVEKPEEPPPPPDPPKEEPKPLVKEPLKEEPPPQPPAAVDAAKVLVAEPAKDEPVDLTNTIVTGNADTSLGGVSQRGGKGTAPTNNLAAVATGTPGGTGTVAAPPAPKVDRSRTARIANLANLERCPFPAEADAEQVDEAAVTVEVKVSVAGRADTVTVTQDPGHGFGREARKCALREKYDAALNVEGAPVPGTYRVRFRFSR